MKIVLFGDSITDMCRDRNTVDKFQPFCQGKGYSLFVAADLYDKDPSCEVINKGNGGNRIVDLYARIKADVWNLKPDVLSILIGINDVWHKIGSDNGVDLERFEKFYRMIIEDTKKVLPNLKFILCEPFFLEGDATKNSADFPKRYQDFCEVYEYAKTVKRLAQEYNLFFLPLQDKFNEKAKTNGAESLLYDGVHTSPAGAKLIADEWLKLFHEKIDCN